jgi:hypothetical protein
VRTTWQTALEWNNDPEVRLFMYDDTTTVFTLEDVAEVYRGVARAAHVFVIELAGRDIGTCWLQDMILRPELVVWPRSIVRMLMNGRGLRRRPARVGQANS